MVLWGLSLIVVSLSFITYKHGSEIWGKFPWAFGRVQARSGTQEHSQGDQRFIERINEGVREHHGPSTNGASLPVDTTDPPAETVSPDSTPKARSARPESIVPSFSLNDSAERLDEGNPKSANGSVSQQAPSLPSVRSPPTLKPLPSETKRSESEMMPPPNLPLPRRMTPTGAQAARVPTTGPLPNRGPPAARSTNSLSIPAAPNTSNRNARNKVVLAPGRSSIDWAQLTKTNRNLAGVQYLQRVTPSQLKQMNGRKGRPVWASYQGRVYNLTPYVPYHPGGEGEIMRAAGKDAERLFNEIHSYVNWENMLGQCCVGIMVTENEEQSKGKDDWEAMD
ncbi:MAG: hypothetical protein Q9165_001865 [Trypethelium subeluteriae]